MSSRKTSKLNLHTWEASDPFKRDEFNENFEALDKNAETTWAEVMKKADAEDLSALQSAMEGKADAATVEKKADKSQITTLQSALTEKAEIKCGTYEGDGKASQTISLGFTPKAVFVCIEWGAVTYSSGTSNLNFYGGLAYTGHPATRNDDPIVSIVNGGFQVFYNTGAANGTIRTNGSGSTFYYIAFK